MRKSLIFTFIIICLFSGIIIGYYIGYIKYVPKIENYKAQISNLILENSKLNSITSVQKEEILILQENLTEAKSIILNYEEQISNLILEKYKLESKLINYEEQINLLKLYLIQANDTISNYEEQISELKMKVLSLQSQILYSNPTYKEVKNFIEKDKTNENKYIPDKYVCIDFATDVNNNAEKQGIRAALVVVYFKNGTHALVAFETTDKGLVFIEPQADKEVKVGIGIRYWVDNNFPEPNYDDTITKILIIW